MGFQVGVGDKRNLCKFCKVEGQKQPFLMPWRSEQGISCYCNSGMLLLLCGFTLFVWSRSLCLFLLLLDRFFVCLFLGVLGRVKVQLRDERHQRLGE